jgi:hypothetical protein
VLADCVAGGASVSFMAPLAPDAARAFWRDVAAGVAAGDRLLLVAEDGAGGPVLGTVQVVFARPREPARTAPTWPRCSCAASARRRGRRARG